MLRAPIVDTVMKGLHSALHPFLQSLHCSMRPEPVSAPGRLPATHRAIHQAIGAILQAADVYGNKYQSIARYPACAMILQAAGQPHRIAIALQVSKLHLTFANHRQLPVTFALQSS